MKASNRLDDVTVARATSVPPLTFPILGQIACNMLGHVTDAYTCNTKSKQTCDTIMCYSICIQETMPSLSFVDEAGMAELRNV